MNVSRIRFSALALGAALWVVAARAGGGSDTFLSMPDTRANQAAKYDKIRELSLDKETKSMEMPAEYMFKDVPKWDAEGMDDPVQILLAELDRHNIQQAIVTPYDGPAERALRESGLDTVRFNFRGTGNSPGEYDNGSGEGDEPRVRLRGRWDRTVRVRLLAAKSREVSNRN